MVQRSAILSDKFITLWSIVGPTLAFGIIDFLVWNIATIRAVQDFGSVGVIWMYASRYGTMALIGIGLSFWQKKYGIATTLRITIGLTLIGLILSIPFISLNHAIFVGILTLTHSIGVTSVLGLVLVARHDILTANDAEKWNHWIIAAYPCGGLLSGLVLWLFPDPSHVISLIIVSILIAAASIPAARQWQLYAGQVVSIPQQDAGLGSVFHFIKHNKLILSVILTAALSVIFQRLFTYILTIAANAEYPEYSDLSIFMSIATIGFHGLALAGSLFTANWLRTRFGLTRSLFVPLYVVGLGSVGLFFAPYAWFIAIVAALRNYLVVFQNGVLQLVLFAVPSRIHHGLNIIFTQYAGVVGGMSAVAILSVLHSFEDSTSVTQQIYIVAYILLILIVIRFFISIQTRESYGPALRQFYDEEDPVTRIRAIEAFSEARYIPKVGVEPLVRIFKNEKEVLPVRIAASSTLGIISDPSTLRPLFHALDATDNAIRLSAIQSLGKFSLAHLPFSAIGITRAEIIPKLEALLSSAQSHREQRAIIRTLIHWEDEKLGERLKEWCESGKTWQQIAVCEAVVDFTDPALIDFLRPLISQGVPEVALRAARIVMKYEWEFESTVTLLRHVSSGWGIRDRWLAEALMHQPTEDELLRAYSTEELRVVAVPMAWSCGDVRAVKWTREAAQNQDMAMYTALRESLDDMLFPLSKAIRRDVENIIREISVPIPVKLGYGEYVPLLLSTLTQDTVSTLNTIAARFQEDNLITVPGRDSKELPICNVRIAHDFPRPDLAEWVLTAHNIKIDATSFIAELDRSVSPTAQDISIWIQQLLAEK